MNIKDFFIALIIALILSALTWFALWYTGAKFDYRSDADTGFVALRIAPETGISYQWSKRGYSVWFWTPDSNTRLLPVE